MTCILEPVKLQNKLKEGYPLVADDEALNVTRLTKEGGMTSLDVTNGVPPGHEDMNNTTQGFTHIVASIHELMLNNCMTLRSSHCHLVTVDHHIVTL